MLRSLNKDKFLDQHYLEAASSKHFIARPESPAHTNKSCLPPERKEAKHSVAF